MVSGLSGVHRAPRPILTELELSRTLDLAAFVLGDPEPTMLFQCGGRTVPSRQRLDVVAVVAERQCRLSALQQLLWSMRRPPRLIRPSGRDRPAR
ncbi:MAG: hypothetical protein M3332_11685 [Actinomycetota bacterium]|nr:hypothetical protein [Actinomycetota bacterium]